MSASFLVLFVASLVPAIAGAQNRWLQVSQTRQWLVELDAATVKRTEDSTYVVWVRSSYADPQVLGDKAFVRTLVQHEIDCPGRRWRERALFFYDTAGNVIYSWDAPSDQPWKMPAPESVGETVVVGGCQILRRAVGRGHEKPGAVYVPHALALVPGNLG